MLHHSYSDNPLPIKRALAPVYALAFLSVLFTSIASLAGILFQISIYPTDTLRQTFVPNDAVNLVLGVPMLLGSLWLTQRGKLIGLILFLLLQPLLTNTPLVIADVVVIFVMGLICFVPFGLFVRGIVTNGASLLMNR